MKKEETKTSEADKTAENLPFSRRDFLKTVGGGIIIFFFAGSLSAQERSGVRPAGQALPADFNAFLRIGADGRVTCFTGKIEMGQGVVTSLAQMLADELDVSVNRVDMIMGDTDLCPWDMGTFGSMSTRFFGPPLRQAASEARSILLALAAERLRVSQGRLIIKDGAVLDKANSRKKVTYAELTKGKYIEKHLSVKPPVKQTSDFRIMGKSHLRKDSVQKVNGEARYTGDIRLPGMLYAKILRPLAHGSKLKRVDTSALRGDGGISVVEEKDFVAVLHPYPDVAEEALSRVKAEFETPDSDLDNKTIHKHLLDVAPREGEVVSEGGNLKEGERLATTTFEETYFDHYVAHAAMETHTATAKIEGDKVTVWASTQTPFAAKESVARELGIPAQKVRVITPFVGGGFGGKSFNLQAIEAARLARLTGKPVQVMWSRKEEFFNDTFRPASIIKIRSGLDEGGRIVLWQYDGYYAGSRGVEQFYAIPHHKEVSYVYRSGSPGASSAHPFATGPWRAPGNNSNTFARESHIDIMAAKLKMDPLEFRTKNLTDKRMLNTLKAVAARSGWKPAATPSGWGYGVACGVDAGACVAAIAEVDVNRGTGKITVKRIVCAQDMGFVINPEGARIQMEGALTMGLGYALVEQVNFKGGQIIDDNFDTYEIPRFSWLPRIETILVENSGYPPQGGGEPAITIVGAVIANAVFDAIGTRLHQMPMTPALVKESLQA
jgi:nicotinate dehydrogenase subunit B